MKKMIVIEGCPQCPKFTHRFMEPDRFFCSSTGKDLDMVDRATPFHPDCPLETVKEAIQL
jgi:endogenous inhibitor of DNA gyrase (YacG/DUF329 family)